MHVLRITIKRSQIDFNNAFLICFNVSSEDSSKSWRNSSIKSLFVERKKIISFPITKSFGPNPRESKIFGYKLLTCLNLFWIGCSLFTSSSKLIRFGYPWHMNWAYEVVLDVFSCCKTRSSWKFPLCFSLFGWIQRMKCGF